MTTPFRVGALAGLLGFLGTVLYMGRAKATVSQPLPFTPAVRQVVVSGRSYNVVALGSGNFTVADGTDPSNSYTFNASTGPTLRTGNTTQLEQDIKSFPKDLFT